MIIFVYVIIILLHDFARIVSYVQLFIVVVRLIQFIKPAAVEYTFF